MTQLVFTRMVRVSLGLPYLHVGVFMVWIKPIQTEKPNQTDLIWVLVWFGFRLLRIDSIWFGYDFVRKKSKK